MRSWNPSIIKVGNKMLIAYNHASAASHKALVGSKIRIAKVDEDFKLIEDYAIDLGPGLPEQADMRLFFHEGRLHGVYFEGTLHHRDAGLVVAKFTDDLTVIDCFRPRFGRPRRYEKNWGFFSCKDGLFCTYTIRPHVVLRCINGLMVQAARTEWGGAVGRPLLVGSPPIEFEGEYLSFFHCWKPWLARGISTWKFLIHPALSVLNRSIGWPFYGAGTWPHRIYSFGAYTFEKSPPFRVLRFTPEPLMTASTEDAYRGLPACVFPCGACWHRKRVVLSYGFHDRECRLLAYSPSFLRAHLRVV